jgi:hypothetical protein
MLSMQKNKKEQRNKSVLPDDIIDDAGPETYDIVETLENGIDSDTIGTSDIDQMEGDTTDKAGDSDLPADMRGHSTGIRTGGEIAPQKDTGGGTEGGGDNLGSEIGIDGITNIGDADLDAGPIIDANTDGTEAGQVGHQGIDEGTG